MRKMLFPITILFLLIACEKDQLAPVDNEEAYATTVDLRDNNLAMAQIDELMTFVEGMNILFGPKKSILVQLRNIKNKLQRGQTNVALAMLDELITHLEGLAADGTVDARVIEELIEKVEWIRCEADPECENPLTVEVNALGETYTLYVTREDQRSGYDGNPATIDIGVRWGGYGHNLSLENKWPLSNALADFNGSGNTNTIVQEFNALGLGGTDYAAKVCAEWNDHGYGDWYLPSLGELKAIYEQLGNTPARRAQNNFKGHFYWSSTEFTAYYAWAQYFSNGEQHYVNKSYLVPGCRCVRR